MIRARAGCGKIPRSAWRAVAGMTRSSAMAMSTASCASERAVDMALCSDMTAASGGPQEWQEKVESDEGCNRDEI